MGGFHGKRQATREDTERELVREEGQTCRGKEQERGSSPFENRQARVATFLLLLPTTEDLAWPALGHLLRSCIVAFCMLLFGPSFCY